MTVTEIQSFILEIDKVAFMISAIVMLILYLALISKWKDIFKSNSWLINYNAVQRLHEGEIPRLGGFVSIIGFIFYWFFSDFSPAESLIGSILLSSIPLIIIGLKEDIFQNTRASIRLIGMIASAIIFFTINPVIFPYLEFPFFANLINNSILLQIGFFSFCILIVINGNNLIDGSNGLMPMSIIMQILCLLFLAQAESDYHFQKILLFSVLPLLIFLIFNYPLGKIFMGDLGAYFFGFIISIFTIIFYGRNPNLPTWGAVLILFYPAYELLFSIIRKICSGLNPTHPDTNHLHLRVFYYLLRKNSKSSSSNNLVMPCLIIIWALPFYFLITTYDSAIETGWAIITMMFIYNLIFWFLPSTGK